jgi:hypothetical protein
MMMVWYFLSTVPQAARLHDLKNKIDGFYEVKVTGSRGKVYMCRRREDVIARIKPMRVASGEIWYQVCTKTYF